jgi:hypothetical protein
MDQNQHKRWTKQEKEWLLNNFNLPIREMSKYLHRTIASIRKQLNNLNIKRLDERKIPWTQNDVDFLIKNHKDISLEKISKYLHRSKRRIYQKLDTMNIKFVNKNHKLWTKEEEQKLLNLCNEKKTLIEIKEIMGRTLHSLRLKLKKDFGISHKGKNLKLNFKSSSFYKSLRNSINSLTSGSQCCICGYNLCIDLHHIDGDRKNNNISNIASLCPNHHREIEMGLHKDKELYCIWWRINADGSISEKLNNKIRFS